MHPPLFRPHPLCEEVVQNLVQCHEEHKIGKFFGSCNQFKIDLDKCFRMEKDIRRKENLKAAQKFDDDFDDFLKTRNVNEPWRYGQTTTTTATSTSSSSPSTTNAVDKK